MRFTANGGIVCEYKDLLELQENKRVIQIHLDKLHYFKEHPFKVEDDERMDQLVDSVKENGILNPIIVRRQADDSYEIISGHRRVRAACLAGLNEVPAIVKQLTDSEAIVMMVDSNIQREEISIKEKAYAFKMKMDAIRHQGLAGTSRHDVEKISAEYVGANIGVCGRQVQRYIRLTELIDEFMDLVDSKKLALVCGVDISYINPGWQKVIYEYIHSKNISISGKQASTLKDTFLAGTLSQNKIEMILGSDNNKSKRKVVLNEKKLSRYFSENYSEDEIEQMIYQLLEKWQKEMPINAT